METLLIAPFLFLGSYLLWHYKKYGMSYSISATAKTLQGPEKFLFTLALWFTALPMMIVGIEKTPDGKAEILFFLAGAMIFLVAAAPIYWKGGMEATMHYVGSYGGIGLGMVASLVYFTGLATWIIVGIYAAFVLTQMALKWSVKNHVYWVEVAAVVLINFLLLIN